MTNQQFYIIAAVDSAMGIAKEGKLPWKFSPDMKYFATVTKHLVSDRNQKNKASFSKVPRVEKNKHYKNAVIMGKNTYMSLPKRPLPDRYNIIVSSSLDKAQQELRKLPEPKHKVVDDSVIVYPDFDKALAYCGRREEILEIYVIGGKRIYEEAIKHPLCSGIYITIFDFDFKCDMKFPPLPDWIHFVSEKEFEEACELDSAAYTDQNRKSEEKTSVKVTKRYYEARNPSEYAYLRVLGSLITADIKQNRTGIDTHSLFAESFKFPLMYTVRNIDCENNIEGTLSDKYRDCYPLLPLLTTKKVAFGLVFKELLWFLRGSTDAKELQQQGVHIWDSNSSREFLDKQDLAHYEEGELGPVYGWQWRRFGAEYVPKASLESSGYFSYTEYELAGSLFKGVDQIKAVIESIKKDPYSRRHVVSAWNPLDLDKMALAPCHYTFVFYVSSGVNKYRRRVSKKWIDEFREEPKYLSCHVTMRSADMFLGVPFNIASYGLLTHIVAKLTGLTAKEVCITCVDCHLYVNHVQAARAQIDRCQQIFNYPQIRFSEKIEKKISNSNLHLEDFDFDSIELVKYVHGAPIKAPMAV